MKTNHVLLLVGAILFGCSGISWAQNFPENVSANYANETSNTSIKVEDGEMRVSVNALNGDPIHAYLFDANQGTIANSSGEVVSRGQEGYHDAYEAMLAALHSAKEGLSESGDTTHASLLASDVTFLADFA